MSSTIPFPQTPKKKRVPQTHLQRSPSKNGSFISSLVSLGLGSRKQNISFDPFAAVRNKDRLVAQAVSKKAHTHPTKNTSSNSQPRPTFDEVGVDSEAKDDGGVEKDPAEKANTQGQLPSKTTLVSPVF